MCGGFLRPPKPIYWPSTPGPIPLRPKDGRGIIKERGAINFDLKEHFEAHLIQEYLIVEVIFIDIFI